MGESNRRDGEEGWSKEGADWFNSLPWDDAKYLLTRQEGDVRDKEDEKRLGRLLESYEKATGYKWATELEAGEYVFECLECNGDGSVKVIVSERDFVWETCSDCRGEGVQYLDEEEAAERIDAGYTPLRTPST
ncbi:hypothetical protein [Microbispora maris]